jgi:hypothetical protein
MSSLNLPQRPIEPFNVLAFDPGGTTGWAMASLHPLVLDRANEDDGGINLNDIAITTGEFGPQEHHQELHEHIRFASYMSEDGALPQVEIVFEPFHYRQNIVGDGGTFRGKVELVSAEYIGIVKLACAQLGLTYYDRFTPGEAKAYVTDQKLELLGWLQEPRHPMRHRNDALRQLVKYLIVKRGIQHPLTTAWRRK